MYQLHSVNRLLSRFFQDAETSVDASLSSIIVATITLVTVSHKHSIKITKFRPFSGCVIVFAGWPGISSKTDARESVWAECLSLCNGSILPAGRLGYG